MKKRDSRSKKEAYILAKAKQETLNEIHNGHNKYRQQHKKDPQSIKRLPKWILSELVDNSIIAVDVRTMESGTLLWYNDSYAQMVKQWGVNLEDVKDWDAINSQKITSYNENMELRVKKGFGWFYNENNFTDIYKWDQDVITNSIGLQEKLTSENEIETHITFNAPVDKDGVPMPIKMVNTILKKDAIVITHFYNYNSLLKEMFIEMPEGFGNHYISIWKQIKNID